MRWLFIVLLLLAACSTENAKETIIEEKDQAISELQQRINSLNNKIEELAATNTELSSKERAAATQLDPLQKTIQQQKAVMDDYAENLASCEDRRDFLEARYENLTKKVDVLQAWVDACQETLDEFST